MPQVKIDPLASFVAAVIEQHECIAGGDAARGNCASEKYIAAARTLLASGEDAIDSFAKLLAHDHDDVRVMAAAFLLRDRTAAAVSALQPIAKGGGLAALGAKMTLERYARGELDIR